MITLILAQFYFFNLYGEFEIQNIYQMV